MYKLITLSGILIFGMIFSGCIIDNRQPDYPRPSACFVTPKDDYAVDERVYFNNCSNNSDSYDWEFGDGYISNEKHPSHVYDKPGNYQVRLSAYGYGARDTYSKIITVSGVTKIDILVNYVGTEDPVSNCLVTLYGSEEDWQNLTSPVASAKTAADGTVVFTNVEPVEYFVDAYREVDETSFYGNEHLGYVVGPLVQNQTNYYTVYVQLLYTDNKTDRSTYAIKRIEKRETPKTEK